MKTIILTLALVSLMMFGNACIAQADTNWITNPSNQHSYKAVSCGNWMDCDASARSEGAHLVTIGSAEEQLWLLNQFGHDKRYWIGFTDIPNEGMFRWTTREASTYTNWASGEPNNLSNNGEDYAVMNWSSGGTWNDLSASSSDADGVAIFEKGLDRYIKGSVGNSTSFSITCTNTTTFQRVSSSFVGMHDWDCKDMGLRVGPGQGFRVQIQGTVK